MPVAICIKCGGKKRQALQFCPHCGFVPTESHDQARSMLLSDQHRAAVELDAAARDIRSKQILLFDPAELQPILAHLQRQRAGRFLGLRRSTWLIIGAALLAGALAAGVTILIQSR